VGWKSLTAIQQKLSLIRIVERQREAAPDARADRVRRQVPEISVGTLGDLVGRFGVGVGDQAVGLYVEFLEGVGVLELLISTWAPMIDRPPSVSEHATLLDGLP